MTDKYAYKLALSYHLRHSHIL